MARARLGQHFLVDQAALDRVAALANQLPGRRVIEVGTGPGNLTARLTGEKVFTVEVDARWADNARRQFKGSANVVVIEADIRDMELGSFAERQGDLKVVGSLPYYITHQMVMKVFAEREWVCSFLWIVQREVAARLASLPGSRETSGLSVQWSRLFETTMGEEISARCFRPAPKVTSSVLWGRRRAVDLFSISDERSFEQLLKTLFGHRRKTVLNAFRLSGMTGDAAMNLLESASVSASKRPEELVPSEWESLARVFGEGQRRTGRSGLDGFS